MTPGRLRFTAVTREPLVRPPPHIPHFVGYHVTDLAPAAGVCDSFEARALNNLGQIVGGMVVGGGCARSHGAARSASRRCLTKEGAPARRA